MNHYSLHKKVVTALKQPWFRWNLVNQYYLFLWNDHNVLSLDWKTCSVRRLKYLNITRWCLSIVFYLMFIFLFGVQQVSVLGPLVFTMYPLGITAQQNGVKYHLYANDIQLYISQGSDNELNLSSSSKNLGNCIADIRLRMTKNLLR